MKIWNAIIHTMTDNGILTNGYISIESGKITEVASGMPDSLSPEDIDAKGSALLPGFIDAHTHLGIIENGIDFEGDDCNEATDPFTPHLRVIDGVNPFDRCFAEARAAGITTAMVSPGSANACGGTMSILKTAGKLVDRMQIGTGMKFALGENPKSVYHGRDEMPVTRMATAAMIREGLAKAQRYQQEIDMAEDDPDEHMPDYDAKSEALLPLLERDMKAHFHCHRADDIATAIRLAEEFHLDYVLVHGTEGFEVAEILAEKHVPVIAGPMLCDRCKPEMKKLTIENPAKLKRAGVKVALCTDHPVIPVQYLSTTAALAVKGGMAREDALYAITAGAAEILGIEERVGKIAVGMDADIQLYHGDPLDLMCDPWLVLIDGEKVVEK
jgi:imidazolonepropionase-like amidohydrolase